MFSNGIATALDVVTSARRPCKVATLRATRPAPTIGGTTDPPQPPPSSPAKPRHPMPYLIFLSICFVWSISFILMKKAGLVLSPAAIAAWRVIGGGAVLGLLWLGRDRCWNVRPRDWLGLLVVAGAGCGWPYYIQPWLIARNGSAFMALMVSFVPLLTILISVPLLRVTPSVRQTVGVCGALVCLACLMWDGQRRSVPLRDIFLALTVPLCYATANVVIRKWLSHLAPLLVTLLGFALSGLLLGPVASFAPGPDGGTSADEVKAYAALAFLSIVGTGIATFFFNKLIREQGPLFAGMTTNIVPLGAVLFGWLDKEHVSAIQILALFGILAMVTLVQFRAAVSSVPPRK
ncbi:MAG: DMT family transporter [Planctomycetota bacterium]